MRLGQFIENHFYNVDVHHFAVAAEIINHSCFSLEEGRHNRGAVISHMNPVAHIQTVAINRERFVTERFDNHERNQFFGELVRPVIVRATRHQHFLAISFVRGQRKKIGAGFARRIWRTGIERRLLGKFAGCAERAIDFVCGDLDEALDAMTPRAIQQHAGADDIRVNKIKR